MSLLSPDRIRLILGPHAVAWRHFHRRFGLRSKTGETRAEGHIPVDAAGTPAWRGALDAINADPAFAIKGASVTVILADEWLRYIIVPWREGLRNDADRLAYAHFRANEVYGEPMEDWHLQCADAPPGRPTIAAGVPRALLADIQALVDAKGMRLNSVQPAWMTIVNRYRRAVAHEAFWFATASARTLALGCFRDRAWQSLHSQPRGVSVADDLISRLDRAALLSRQHDTPKDVWIFAPDVPDVRLPAASPWKLHALPTGQPKGVGKAVALSSLLDD